MNKKAFVVFVVFVAFVVSLAGCASSGENRGEDGGLVDPDGWPSRRLEASAATGLQTMRCPEHTYLSDQTLPDGRRRVACLAQGTTHLMGFRLSWHPAGTMASDLRFDAAGLPSQKTTWYEDGIKKSEAFYEGTRTTKSATWYGDGAPRSYRVQSEDGGLTEVQRWQIDGEVEVKGSMLGAEKVGDWLEWRDGALESRSYVAGLVVGSVERRYPDGSQEAGEYERGARTGKWKRVDAETVPIHEVNYKKGLRQGPAVAWHPNGQVRSQSEYLQDRMHGRHQTWYPSGQIKRDGTYDCGAKVGLWTAWYSDGGKETRGFFAEGQRAGLWMKWSAGGEVLQEEFLEVPLDDAGRPAQTMTTPDGYPFVLAATCQSVNHEQDEIETIRTIGTGRPD
jgi:antitoxin component YwqK of YwqJK toxin-antitoxin module